MQRFALLDVALAEQRVDAEEEAVGDLLLGLGVFEGVVTEIDGLVPLAERVHQHFGALSIASRYVSSSAIAWR